MATGNQPGPNQPSIMIVDDEIIVTQVIKSFLELETDYNIRTFQSPVEALAHLDRNRVDLIISDFLMPDMNGLEFLARVKARSPSIVRILLTGYADKENAIRAINDVDLFQYIEKPWDNAQLVLIIKNGLRQKALDTRLRAKIDDLDRAMRDRDRLEHERNAFREEMQVARRVQQAILPSELPSVGGFSFSAMYRPAHEVGGDFYDVIDVGDGLLAAFVADATGHGIQAALSTTLIKAAFNEVASVSRDAADILLQVNDVIHRVLPNDLFVAGTIATIDTVRGRVCVVGGGGPHPFHVLCSSRRAASLASNGLPLGVVESRLYPPPERVEVDLSAGDAVFIYTDGLSEVENSDGCEFGTEGICNVLCEIARDNLPLRDLARHALSGAEAFAHDRHEWDDVTSLTIMRR